jgi:DNA-binding NtrC family response regulator
MEHRYVTGDPNRDCDLSMAPPAKVYVVDDEPIIALTLATILNASGFQATAFTNPETALEAAKYSKPSILITDVLMRQMTGIDLAIQLISTYPDCKVLLCSGQATTDDLLNSARETWHDFELLEKPIHPKDLLAALGKL